MKVKDVIAWADEVKPNAFSAETKRKWMGGLEGSIALEVFLMDRAEAEQLSRAAEQPETELLVSAPYDDLYELWLEAKIDQANGEYDKYQNSMQIYNARRGEFVCWFCQTYDPAQGYRTLEAEEMR